MKRVPYEEASDDRRGSWKLPLAASIVLIVLAAGVTVFGFLCLLPLMGSRTEASGEVAALLNFLLVFLRVFGGSIPLLAGIVCSILGIFTGTRARNRSAGGAKAAGTVCIVLSSLLLTADAVMVFLQILNV